MLRVLLRTGEDLLRTEDSQRTRVAFADNLQRFVYAIYPGDRDLVGVAETQIKKLGGSRLQFGAGPMSLIGARCLGWKAAKRLRGLSQTALRR